MGKNWLMGVADGPSEQHDTALRIQSPSATRDNMNYSAPLAVEHEILIGDNKQKSLLNWLLKI